MKRFLFVTLLLAGMITAFDGCKKADPATPETETPEQADLSKDKRDMELFERISALMEGGIYMRKGLSIADLATALGTNTKYISSSINAGAGCSYFDYVNGYRIRHAQKILKEDSHVRISDLSDAIGFTSESAFYRNFKVVTGQTPSEWQKGLSA